MTTQLWEEHSRLLVNAFEEYLHLLNNTNSKK
jgi:hypothetical protein